MVAIKCTVCSKWFAGHRDECPFCETGTAFRECRVCGKLLSPDREKCPNCETPIRNEDSPRVPQARSHPNPTFHLSPRVFEQYCTEVSKYLGYEDAEVTRQNKDGGYDIHSSRMLGQVKFQELPVGVKPLRELLGLALHAKKDALVFALNGFTQDALSEAEIYGILLFEVKPMEAKTIARSGPASSLLKQLNR